MTKIEELETAITALPEEEYAQFRRWFLDRDWQKWDQEIEADSESGKLDFLLREAAESNENQSTEGPLMHRTTEQFRQRYGKLPKEVRTLADKSFQLLKDTPRHPSLQLKKVGKFWSARVGLTHRVLAVEDGNDRIWVWIGGHDEYEKVIGTR